MPVEANKHSKDLQEMTAPNQEAHRKYEPPFTVFVCCGIFVPKPSVIFKNWCQIVSTPNFAFQISGIPIPPLPPPGSNKRPKTSHNQNERGAPPSPNRGVGGLHRVVQHPSPTGGTAHLTYDAWNLHVGSLGGPSPKNPMGGGGREA